MNILGIVFVPEEGQDSRIWAISKDGTFSVSPQFSALLGNQNPPSTLHFLWKIKAPRVIALGWWLALCGRILTMDNRWRRRIIIINGCPTCLADEEKVDHLLLGCKTAYSLWISILGWFGLSWVFPKTLLDHFNAWKLTLGTTKGKHLWRTSLPPYGLYGERGTLYVLMGSPLVWRVFQITSDSKLLLGSLPVHILGALQLI